MREKRNFDKEGEINGDKNGLREGKTLRREEKPMRRVAKAHGRSPC